MLKDLLRQRCESILEKWQNSILETYPEDSLAFIKNQKDRFQNPVGHTLRKAAKILLEALIEGKESDAISTSLDELVRIRSVQDFQPAQAIAPVFLLKNVVREELQAQLEDTELYAELLGFESQIDGLALLAFDNYVKCKLEIYDIRARETQRMSAKLLERLNRSPGTSGRPDSSLDNNT